MFIIPVAIPEAIAGAIDGSNGNIGSGLLIAELKRDNIPGRKPA